MASAAALLVLTSKAAMVRLIASAAQHSSAQQREARCATSVPRATSARMRRLRQRAVAKFVLKVRLYAYIPQLARQRDACPASAKPVKEPCCRCQMRL